MAMVRSENLSKGYLVTLCLLLFADYLSKIIALNYIEVLQQNNGEVIMSEHLKDQCEQNQI